MSSGAARVSSEESNDFVVRRGAIALFALFALVYLLPLGIRPLSSPDEVRYGEIAHEMIASGDWVSPHFNGARYFEKPVLGHWLNALSVSAFGESPYAVRLPVALATGLSALIVFLLTRNFLARSTALLASAIFLTTLLVAGCGSVAVLDAILALCTTAAVAAYYVAITADTRGRRLAYLALCGVACGAAFLTKGFIAWAIPAVVAAPYLLVRREWRTLLTSPWLPFGVAILVSLPWAVLIHLREPDFWRYFVVVEHLQRFAGDNAQHAQPPWFFLAYLPAIGWPWAWLLPAAAIGLRGGDRHKDFLFYTALWALMPFLFFSASKGKLLTYVLPCFAPLSILLAAGVERYLASGRARAFRIAAGLAAALLALLLLLLAASQAGRFGAPAYGAGEHSKLVAMAALLVVSLACAIIAFRSNRPSTRLVAFTGAAVAFFLPLDTVLPQRAVDVFAPSTAIAHYATTPADTLLVSDASLAGAVAWELKRNDVYVVNPGEMNYGLSYPEASDRKLVGTNLAELIAANRGVHDILILCEPGTEKDIDSQLPPSAERSSDGRVRIVRIPR
jgi:4-amino-4-deoxy-L-arabinose transferase